MWWTSSLRTADAFPVVASLPPLLFGGREATTGNASAVRRLLNEVKEQVSQGCLTRTWLLVVVWRSTGVLIPLQEPFYRQNYSTASTSFEQKVKKVEIASLHANATLTYFRLSRLFSRKQRCYRMLLRLIGGRAECSEAKGHIECWNIWPKKKCVWLIFWKGYSLRTTRKCTYVG